MSIRVLMLVMVMVGPAWGQRIDVLTGEPERPRGEARRSDGQIFNAPHAPRQERHDDGGVSMDVYVVPQIGGGGGFINGQTGLNRSARRY